jgi:phenylacetate-CoA ligase
MNAKVMTKGLSHLLVKRGQISFWKRRKWLERTQYYSRKDLEEIQLKLLKKLVRHCYDTVDFYRELMLKHDITVDSIQTLDDIKRFPVIGKRDVLAAGDSIISKKYPNWATSKGRTGGTTGTPLVTPRNFSSLASEHSFLRRQWDWAGIKMTDNTAYLSGRIIVDANKSHGPFYAFDPFMRELVLSTYHLSAQTVSGFVAAIHKYKVKAIVGYPASICFFAKVCHDMGIEVKLKAVLTTSETVTDSMRATITEVFGCRLFDYYGSAERVCYIFTCDKGSYHITPEYGLTELLPIAGADEQSFRIVGTGFWNMAMPLIRYDLGDSLIKTDEKCSCGRQFPVVRTIIGRTGDLIRTPSGKEFGPTLLARVAKGANNILASQIVQDRIDHLDILYVPSDHFTEVDLSDFKKHMSRHLPDELRLDYKQVDAVERTASGKTNLLISRI